MATVKAPVSLEVYRRRMVELRDYAEDDGMQINEGSEGDFWSFIRSAPISGGAALFLMDNGNLRAVWKGEDSSHIGIQFLGHQKVEYVIFRRQEGSDSVSRVAGVDTLSEIEERIDNLGLASFVIP